MKISRSTFLLPFLSSVAATSGLWRFFGFFECLFSLSLNMPGPFPEAFSHLYIPLLPFGFSMKDIVSGRLYYLQILTDRQELEAWDCPVTFGLMSTWILKGNPIRSLSWTQKVASAKQKHLQSPQSVKMLPFVGGIFFFISIAKINGTLPCLMLKRWTFIYNKKSRKYKYI